MINQKIAIALFVYKWYNIVCCGFCLLQLYNEEVLDLFDGGRDPESRNRKSAIKIHEDASGSIYTSGVTSRLVHTEEEVSVCVFVCICVCVYPHV